MKRGLLIGGGLVAVVLVSLITAACGFFIGRASVDTGGSVPVASEENGGQVSPQQADGGGSDDGGSEVGNAELSVGDTANIDGVQVTLLEAFRTGGDNLDSDSLPDDSYTFVVGRFRVQNGTSQPVNLGGESEIGAYSDAGAEATAYSLLRQNESSAPREDQDLLYSDVRPGADITGTVAVIAREEEAISFEYLSSFLEPADASWNVGPVNDLEEREFVSTY